MTAKKSTEKTEPEVQPAGPAEDIPFDQRPGSDLFRPVNSLRPSEVTRLMARGALLADHDEHDMNGVAELVEYIEDHFIIDMDAWQEFYVANGITEVMTLATAYVGEAVADAR